VDTLFVALRVALSLGVVLALLWVLQKRIAKGGLRPGRASAPVTVVARQGIGAKASVVVVDVEGERLVLGVTESSVTVLAAADVPAPVVALEVVQEARVTPIAPVTPPAPAPLAPTAPSFDAVLAADAPHLPARLAPNGHLAAAGPAVSGNSFPLPRTSAGLAGDAPARVASNGGSAAVEPAISGNSSVAATSSAPMLRPRGAARRAAVRDPRERGRGRTTKALEGSILAPDTWRQAAAAVRAGRAG